MIDHLIIGVDDLDTSSTFYEHALAPLGMEIVLAMPHGVGFGRDGKPAFWIAGREASGPVHVAFASPDRATVDAFHAAALAAGGHDNGGPGCALTTTRRTTAPSSTTPTATTSRLSATGPSRGPAVPQAFRRRQRLRASLVLVAVTGLRDSILPAQPCRSSRPQGGANDVERDRSHHREREPRSRARHRRPAVGAAGRVSIPPGRAAAIRSAPTSRATLSD